MDNKRTKIKIARQALYHETRKTVKSPVEPLSQDEFRTASNAQAEPGLQFPVKTAIIKNW